MQDFLTTSLRSVETERTASDARQAEEADAQQAAAERARVADWFGYHPEARRPLPDTDARAAAMRGAPIARPVSLDPETEEWQVDELTLTPE